MHPSPIVQVIPPEYSRDNEIQLLEGEVYLSDNVSLQLLDLMHKNLLRDRFAFPFQMKTDTLKVWGFRGNVRDGIREVTGKGFRFCW